MDEIPAVYVFSGTEGMSAGPSLMFVSLPKVFNAMGKAGVFVGILFFVTAIFATLTSCISVLESITANCMEIFHSGRKKTVLVLAVIYLVAERILSAAADNPQPVHQGSPWRQGNSFGCT